MTSVSFPLLRNEADGVEFPVGGRVFTFGGSKECNLPLPGKGLPGVVGHLLFREGKHLLQLLSQDATVKVNGVKVSSPVALKHADGLEMAGLRFRFLEKPAAPDAPEAKPAPASASVPGDRQPLADLIESVVALLKEKDSDVFLSLVTGVSRLLRCDAARVVEEDWKSGERRTLARYPGHSGLERFSNRAIDWSRESEHAILVQETEWEDGNSYNSLQQNAVASVLCTAMREESGIIGYLYMDRVGGGSPFTEADRRMCDSLGRLFGEILSHRRALSRQRDVIARLQSGTQSGGGGIIQDSPAMAKVMELARRVARTDGTVLIRGETGTGKEMLARFIHQQSQRAEKPFVAINCAAIPENLIESELFGHEKGAFTGADQRKIGLFESAEGGTLFLDEIGDLPLGLQVKLLRVLQESEIMRIGHLKPIRVDVRIFSATHRKLSQEVQQGRFRQDLFFRLSVLDLELPPLRERGQDVLLLAEFLLKKFVGQFGLPAKTLSPAARNKLLGYAFPGNVRELENVIQKAILLSNARSIGAEEIQIEAEDPETSHALRALPTLKDARAAAEKEAIRTALEKTGGNISLASKLLNIDRKWLMKMMEELDLDADDFRA